MTLKELEEKEYPFLDSKVSGILDQLLEQKIIELPTPKKIISNLKQKKNNRIVTCSMVSFVSFDPILIAKKKHTFFCT